MTMSPKQNDTSQSSISESVLKRIEDESVCPTPWWVFFCQTCFFRTAWVLSVVFGSLAVSISFQSMLHARYSFYEATHESLYTFLVEALPFLWFALIVLTGVLAVYNFRAAGCGYRYPITRVLVSTVGLSVVIGSLLSVFGVGALVDKKLGENMPSMYASLEQKEMRLWMHPEDGRLVGTIAPLETTSSSMFLLDNNDMVWELFVLDLSREEQDLLSSGKLVRVLGAPLGTSTRLFHACGVFPWMMDEPFMPLSERAREREHFLERMTEYQEEVLTEVELLSQEIIASHDVGICSMLPTVARMRQRAF